MNRNRLRLIWLTALGSLCGAAAPQTGSSFDGFKLVDKAGNIQKPVDYRDRLQLIGAYMVLDPKENQLHYTYASRGAVEYYRRHGPGERSRWSQTRAVEHWKCELGRRH